MKNPLHKRFLRDLKSEAGRYLVIFLLLFLTIALVCGFLVSDVSLIAAYNESFEKYNIEDGNFVVSQELNRAQRKTIQEMGVALYDMQYANHPLTNGTTLRIYPQRQQVNLVCLMDGSLPQQVGEIAVDRMYAENNNLAVGDVLSDGASSWRITGLVALPDYSCLFENNSDTMFDAKAFGVAIVTPQDFAQTEAENITWCYSWKYAASPADEAEERDLAQQLLKQLAAEVTLQTYVPCYQNQAIQFTGEDMGSDKAMMILLLYIVIAIMAFVFSILVNATIQREANVIGTLRASGYTRQELIRHYMTMPLLVTLVSAGLGNLVGYTIMKDFCASLYYGSYSLTTYVTRWSAEAFVETTVVPVLLMALIHYTALRRKLALEPLRFLRGDIASKKQKKALPLHPALRFFSRFRLRVIFQNAGNYVVLFVGILFANLLLMFGLLLPLVLEHYQQTLAENLLCNYQYLLNAPLSAAGEDHKLESLVELLKFSAAVQTQQPTAEPFSAYSLKTTTGREEEVTIYGVQAESRYIPLPSGQEGVAISSAYAGKAHLSVGDAFVLKEIYSDKTYLFRVGAIYPYDGALAIFMEQKACNAAFELGEDYFCGYLSDCEITDIDSQYIATVIDLNALTKVSRQLSLSMGNMMNVVNGFSVLIFVVLIYLLSKTVIEKNAQAISMAKILGYSNGEIARLYVLPTALVTLAELLISLPVETVLMKLLLEYYISMEMNGYLPFYINGQTYLTMLLLGVGSYAVVALLELRRVYKVPMGEALKHVE